MALVVRTWNLFHGNAKPPERHAFLREMLELASADDPDVLCLQELPAWALPHLAGWSRMQAFAELAQPPRFGPLPITAELGRVLTETHHGLLRSAFAGQANAILVNRDAEVLSHDQLVLNSRDFRAAQAEWLGLGLVARLGWAKERRVVQALRVRMPDGMTALVANLHATAYSADQRLADAELLRAAVFADGLAAPDDVVVLAGDFNVPADRSATQAQLVEDAWGFSHPIDEGIDQILVRNAAVRALERWPRERRMSGERVLSDHAPVEAKVA